MQYIRVVLKDLSVIRTDSEHCKFDKEHKMWIIEDPIHVKGKLAAFFTKGLELKEARANAYQDPENEKNKDKLAEFKLYLDNSNIYCITQSANKK